jgi:DNA-binding TFAR19-related protein (PDSD5 family)
LLAASRAPQQEQGGNQTVDQMQEQQAKQAQQEEAKASILSSILSVEASQRLGTIRMVNKDKAERVEMMLIQMAQQGQIKEKISEAKIVTLLGQASEAGAKVEILGKRSDDLAGSQWDDGEEDPMAKAMAMGARIPGKGDDSDDY